MLSGLIRKTRQLLSDPVLRRWVYEELAHNIAVRPGDADSGPPYLRGLLPLPVEPARATWPEFVASAPDREVVLPLAGVPVHVSPGDEKRLFRRAFDDLEQYLALHRFAWIPEIDQPDWTRRLWAVWLEQFGDQRTGWSWHPYTAAERAINILAFAANHGTPGARAATAECLAHHAPAIAGNLEYFGEDNTSNHLFNNGRGLYILGLELGLEKCAEVGARIVIEEAKRIFLPSGVLREGSTHYHLLIANRYASLAQLARRHRRPEAEALTSVAAMALAAARRLVLPGGLPLIGDISPDATPDDTLANMAAWDTPTPQSVSDAALAADGWIRFDDGVWSGLWHVVPQGWPPIPGHGHQDCGSFEVHWNDIRLFVDPGRGTYKDGDADPYLSALMHNSLVIDGQEPYPSNKPYYSAVFRERVAGPRPIVEHLYDRVTVTHHGYGRFPGGGWVRRSWRFIDNSFTLDDEVEGTGKHRIVRQFITPWPVRRNDEGAVIEAEGATFTIRAEGDPRMELMPTRLWSAYGVPRPGTIIRLTDETTLSWRGILAVEAR